MVSFNFRRLGALAALFVLVPGLADATSVLRRGHRFEPETLDPAKTDANEEFWLQQDLFEGLTRINGDGKLVPGAAERWEVSPDGLVWTFHLRPNLEWSDGSVLNADDFVFSFRRAVTPKTAAPYASIFYPIVNARAINEGAEKDLTKLGVTAPDASTIRIALTEPTAYLPGVLAIAIALPVPRQVIDAYGDEWTRPGKIIGNGAYYLAEWVPQSDIVMRRNPHYYDAANVKIDEVHHVVAEDETAFKKFRSGELDFARVPEKQLRWARENLPQNLQAHPSLWTVYLIANTAKPPLNDRRVREALSLAIDREVLVDKIDQHGEVPAYALVPPGIEGYTPQPPDWVALSKPERLARARQLLLEAGYGPDHKLKFDVIYATSQQVRKDVTAITIMWKQSLGVEATGVNEENQIVESQMRNHNFQMAWYGWIADYPDPQTFLGLLRSTAGYLNTPDYRNPEYDALLDKGTLTLDPTERLRVFEQSERVEARDQPFIPVYYDGTPYVVSDKLKHYTGNPLDQHPSRDLEMAP